MISQDRPILDALLLALQSVRLPEQIDMIWKTLEAACRQAGIMNIGTKPNSVPQANSVAKNLRQRILG